MSQYVFLNKAIGLLLLYLAYAVVTSTVTDWMMLHTTLRVFVASVVLQNIVALAAFFVAHTRGVDNPWTSYDGRRLSGLLVDANAYGGFLVAAWALLEGACTGTARLLRGWSAGIARVTLACGILFTFSRTAWISFGLVFLLVWIRRPHTLSAAIMAVMAALTGMIFVAGDSVRMLIQDMAARPELARGRFELVELALRQFAQHPLFGAGLNSFREKEGTVVHNTALWFLTDFGLIGFIIFAGFVSWFFVKGRAAYRFAPVEARPLIVGLMLAHVAMLGMSMGIEAFYQRHWWLVMALIGSAYSLAVSDRYAGGAGRGAR